MSELTKIFLGGGAVINRSTAVQWNSSTKSLWLGISIDKGGGQKQKLPFLANQLKVLTKHS